jgi:hypothetical protein
MKRMHSTPEVIQLKYLSADRDGMDKGVIEPRTALWARAEVSWQNQTGTLCVAPATLEDTSRSGACVRVDRPIEVGSKVTIKWHREQFSAVTKNCRSDGREFLLGVRREAKPKAAAVETTKGNAAKPAASPTDPRRVVSQEPVPKSQPPAAFTLAKLATLEPVSALPISASSLAVATQILSGQRVPVAAPANQGNNKEKTSRSVGRSEPAASDPVRTAATLPGPNGSSPSQSAAASRRASRSGTVVRSSSQGQTKDGNERRVMESKSLFSRFARRQEGTDAADKAGAKQAPGNGFSANSAQTLTGAKGELLSYEDIYRAAGILGSRSGYDISKVVEMLHCDRLRSLAADARRASVLMAIEAAGVSADDLLREATERERALDAYESNQKKHLEEYEARKAQENVQIEAEMARVTAHYAERIKANLDQLASEKEALRNWQMAKQSESQRIAEVVELCAKQEASEPRGAAMAAAAGARSGGTAINSSGPSLVPGGISSRPN